MSNLFGPVSCSHLTLKDVSNKNQHHGIVTFVYISHLAADFHSSPAGFFYLLNTYFDKNNAFFLHTGSVKGA